MTTPASLLNPDAFLSPLAIDEAVRRALDEDLGRAGDITSIATIPEATPPMPSWSPGRPAWSPGCRWRSRRFDDCRRISTSRRIFAMAPRVAAGARADDLRPGPRHPGGRAHRAEFRRPAVGHRHADGRLCPPYHRHQLRICCTRKTTPGLRALEKYAVRCGGGFNHRFGLDDAILIKDNHIAVAGGIPPVLQRARAHAGHLVKIEIEVDTLDQLREVLDTGLPTWCCSTTWISRP